MAIRARIQAIAGVILVGSCILVKAQMYPFGTLMGDTSVNLKGDAQTCIDFRNVRIVNPIVSGTTSLTDLVTPNGKLCMSPNGGISFDETVFGSTFAAVPEAPAVPHPIAILPLYMDYSTSGFGSDVFGLFYQLIPCGADLDAYVSDLSTCGLDVGGFQAFWGIKVTWGNMESLGPELYWSADPLVQSPSNTFQVVLFGNAGESTYAIINYGRLDAVDLPIKQRIIQGVGNNTQPLDPLGNNCGAGTGRYVFYLSDDQVLAPGGAPVCDAALNCGRYGLTDASLPTVSGTCDAMGECICSAGYSGLYCLNDDACDCNPNPCDAANTILCGDTGMVDPAFKCHCNFGFTGATCDTAILACDSSPCEHGGTCTDIPYDFQCACPSNWQGTMCETDVDECAAAVNPCLNGGTCTDTNGGFTCTYADGYTGDTYSLYPDRGPLAGGTVITLLGNGLQSPYPVTAVNIGDDYLATVQFCNDTYLEAITSVGMETDVNRKLRIRLVFQDQRIISVDDHVTFTYRSNPTIRDINPLLTVLEGGTFLTVSGSSLDSVWKPYVEVTTNIRRFLTAGQNSDFNVTNIQSSEICELVNISSETSLLCPTPPSDIPDDILATTGNSAQGDADSAIVTYDTDLAVVTLYIGFKFDGYKAYTNISNVTDEALAAKGVLEIVVTPYFNVTLEAEHSEGTPLHIPGYFVDVIDVSNYVVEVGEGGCQRVEISSRLLICFPPSPNDQGAPSGRDVTHAIKVRPGRRLVYAVGSMTYRSNRQLIIGLSIGGALLVLLAITIIAVVFGLRMRTSRRQDDKMAPLRNPDAEIHLGPLPVTST